MVDSSLTDKNEVIVPDHFIYLKTSTFDSVESSFPFRVTYWFKGCWFWKCSLCLSHCLQMLKPFWEYERIQTGKGISEHFNTFSYVTHSLALVTSPLAICVILQGHYRCLTFSLSISGLPIPWDFLAGNCYFNPSVNAWEEEKNEYFWKSTPYHNSYFILFNFCHDSKRELLLVSLKMRKGRLEGFI